MLAGLVHHVIGIDPDRHWMTLAVIGSSRRIVVQPGCLRLGRVRGLPDRELGNMSSSC